MQFHEGGLFHIYNRGNNKQRIFFDDRNYLYFLRKTRRYIFPVCDILGYCLMPNHFHFLIHANKFSVQTKVIGREKRNVLSEGFRLLLSSYCLGINAEKDRTGSLFQQNTKAKMLDISEGYPNTCFHYIQQNPSRAGLVKKPAQWPYSSLNEYLKGDEGGLCNRELAYNALDLSFDQLLYKPGRKDIVDDVRKIYCFESDFIQAD